MKPLKTILATAALLTSFSTYAQKNLGLEASPNFRELGGIETADGKILKDHLIYRSGSFSNLPEEDKEKLAKTGITTVIDFRSDYEIKREPDDIPASLDAEWINSPIGNIDPKSMQQFMKALTGPSFSTDQVDSLMIAANKGFVDNITDFKPLFDHLLEKDEVVLFHCSAGKDRTGFASSLLLYTLGADWDTIMADYLRSNEADRKSVV